MTHYIYIYIGIDDIRSAKKVEAIAVQFFNGFGHNTASSGLLKPRTTIIITANSPFCDSERLKFCNSNKIIMMSRVKHRSSCTIDIRTFFLTVQ